MDSSDRRSKIDEIEKFKILEENKEAKHKYIMKSAGYGVI